MKPESVRFLERACTILARADTMLRVELYEDAARSAYLASFHVADDARADPQLRRFLSQAYEFKSAADYATGLDAVISDKVAGAAVTTAAQFVRHFAALVPIEANTGR